MDWSSDQFGSDPARIVAQVVSGIGFLGAGAILRIGVNIKGLTTAGSLWTTAIIGIACGAGYYLLATVTALIVITVLGLVGKFETWVLTEYQTRELKVSLKDREGIIDELTDLLKEEKVKIKSMSAGLSSKNNLKLAMVIRVPAELKMCTLINIINSLKETESMEIE